MTSENFLHCANFLYLICYGVRDVLLLRVLAVTAMFVILPYYIMPDKDEVRLAAAHKSGDHAEVIRLIEEENVLEGFGDPSWQPIQWNLLFASVNLFWIVRILLERRPPRLTPDQKKLYDLTFYVCSPREMLQLLAHAKWREADAGQSLVEQGEMANKLVLVHSGSVSVRVKEKGKDKEKDKEVARLGDGDFVGEMSYLTGEQTVARVVTSTPVRYLEWDRDQLQRLSRNHVGLKSALNAVIGHNLIEKLTSLQNRVPELSTVALRRSDFDVLDGNRG